MQLAERRQIDLDISLREYLPDFQMKDNGEGVTPRNLLSHHSGSPSNIFKGIFSRQPENYKRVVRDMNKEYMAGIPNQIRAYSNPGYTLLVHMIAEVSGKEYPEYILHNILEPYPLFHGFQDCGKGRFIGPGFQDRQWRSKHRNGIGNHR